MAPSPASRDQPPLQVLPGGDQQSLDIDVLEASASKAAQAVPFLGFGKQRLDPNLALAHRLLVGLGGVISPHLLQVLGIEGAVDHATMATGSAGSLDGARVA